MWKEICITSKPWGSTVVVRPCRRLGRAWHILLNLLATVIQSALTVYLKKERWTHAHFYLRMWQAFAWRSGVDCTLERSKLMIDASFLDHIRKTSFRHLLQCLPRVVRCNLQQIILWQFHVSFLRGKMFHLE